jgi:hypothetical protein
MMPQGFDAYFRRFTLRQKAGLAAEVIGAYVRARRSLSRNSLPETLSGLRRPIEASPSARTDSRRVVAHRLAKVVVRVLAGLPMDSRCLTRSVVLTDVLAKRGIPSSLVIGVATTPDFAAHAWVELDGEPLLPTGDGKYTYARLVEL